MPKFLAPTDAEFVEKVRVYTTGPRGPRPRSDEQKEWDEAFVNAMNGVGYLAVQILPEEADAARKFVQSAARLNGRAVTEGEPKAGRTKGTVVLTWKIRVPVKTGPRKKKAETPEVAE